MNQHRIGIIMSAKARLPLTREGMLIMRKLPLRDCILYCSQPAHTKRLIVAARVARK